MSRFNKLIGRDAIYSISILWLMQLISGVCAFLTHICLARYFEVGEYGSIVAALAIITFVSPLAGFGIGSFWLRCFGKEGWGAYRWVHPSMRLVLVTSIITFGLVMLWAFVFKSNSLVRILVLLFSIFIFSQVALELASATFQLQSKYKKLAILQAMPNTLKFIILIIVIIANFSIMSLAYGYLLVGTAVLLYCLLVIKKLAKFEISIEGHGAKPQEFPLGKKIRSTQIIYVAWPFALAGIFYFIYFQIDLIMITAMLGPEFTAKYNSAVVILTAIYTIPSVVFQKYLLPKYHRWAEHNQTKFYRVFCGSNRIVLFFGAIAGIITALLSKWLIGFLFGPDYYDAGFILMILSLCIPVRYLSTSMGAALVTGRNMRRKVIYQGIVALCNVIMNAILIPWLGILGAAISTVLSEVILLVLYMSGAIKHVFALNNGWECFIYAEANNGKRGQQNS